MSTDDAKERFDSFVRNFDDYLSLNNITKKTPTNIDRYLEMDEESLRVLTQEECQNIAFLLISNSLCSSLEKSKLKAIIDWCESSLAEIIARETISLNLGDMIAKSEVKLGMILNSCPLAREITRWKMVAASRYDAISSYESSCRKLSDILMEKSRRR